MYTLSEKYGIKHLPGQHDQLTHGREKLSSASLGAMIPKKLFGFTENKQRENEAKKMVEDTIDDLVIRFPKLKECVSSLKEVVLVDDYRLMGQGKGAIYEMTGKYSSKNFSNATGNYNKPNKIIGVSLADDPDDFSSKWIEEKPLTFGKCNINRTPSGTLRHEIGHHFMDNDDALINDVDSLISSKPLRARDAYSLSVYAATNGNEFFAESFSAYTHPRFRKGSLPIPEMEAILDKYVGGKTKKYLSDLFLKGGPGSGWFREGGHTGKGKSSLDKDYGGLPEGGGYDNNTEYEVGHQVYAEAAHCIVGSLGKLHRSDYKYIDTEEGHIKKEYKIMKDVIEEYSRPVYNNQLMAKEGDNKYLEATLKNMKENSPRLHKVASEAKANLGDVRDGYKQIAEKSFDAIIRLAEVAPGINRSLSFNSFHDQNLIKITKELGDAIEKIYPSQKKELSDTITKAKPKLKQKPLSKEQLEFQFRETTTKYEKQFQKTLIEYFKDQEKAALSVLKKGLDDIEVKHGAGDQKPHGHRGSNRDIDYMRAIESGDIATAQGIVEELAKIKLPKLSVKLAEEVRFRIDSVNESGEEQGTIAGALRDLIEDSDDPKLGAHEFLRELQDIQIALGIVNPYTKTQIDGIYSTHPGKKYDFKRGTVFYRFETWEPLERLRSVAYDDEGNIIPLSERFKGKGLVVGKFFDFLSKAQNKSFSPTDLLQAESLLKGLGLAGVFGIGPVVEGIKGGPGSGIRGHVTADKEKENKWKGDFQFSYKQNAGGKKEVLALKDPTEIKRRLDFVIANMAETYQLYFPKRSKEDYKQFWMGYLKDEIAHYRKLKGTKSYFPLDSIEEHLLSPSLGLTRIFPRRKKVVQKSATETQEMRELFEKRTNIHIKLVQKYLQKIIDLNDKRLNNKTLEAEKHHDQSKFEEPEYTPYLHVNWHYHLKDKGEEYNPSEEIKAKMDEATFHHVKANKHHPEYWDTNSTEDAINRNDRDKTPEKQVDATKMPLDYVASMVADWLAMSDEKKTDPFKWAEKMVNKRWKFTKAQVQLIDDLIDGSWIEKITVSKQEIGLSMIFKGGPGSGSWEGPGDPRFSHEGKETDFYYHGTSGKFVDLILNEGLKERTFASESKSMAMVHASSHLKEDPSVKEIVIISVDKSSFADRSYLDDPLSKRGVAVKYIKKIEIYDRFSVEEYMKKPVAGAENLPKPIRTVFPDIKMIDDYIYLVCFILPNESKSITKASPNAWPDRFNFEDWAYADSDWNKRLAEEGGLFIKEIYEKEGKRVWENLYYQLGGLEGSFDINNPRVLKFIANYSYKFVQGINATTVAMLQAAMSTGMEEGLGMDGIAGLIRGVFENCTKYRSLLIARTETIRASNGAAREAYEQSGVVEGMEWLVTIDDRTCPLCNAMSGKVVGLDENFFNLGESLTVGEGANRVTMKFDYEDVGYPPLHPNCRCTVVPNVYEEYELPKSIGLNTILKHGTGDQKPHGHRGTGKGSFGKGVLNLSSDQIAANKAAIDLMNKDIYNREVDWSEESKNALGVSPYGMLVPQANKLFVQTTISNKLENNDAFSIEDVPGIGSYDMIGMQKASVEKYVRTNVDEWAGTSGDTNPDAVATQLIAERVFKIGDSAVDHYGDEALKGAQKLLDDPKFVERKTAFLQAQYDATQKYFKDNNIKELILYRGVEHNDAGKLREETIQLQPISSFSVTPLTALRFAKISSAYVVGDDGVRRPPSNTGTLYASVISVEKILSHPRTGFGCTLEGEVTVLGGKCQSTVVSTKVAWDIRQIGERMSGKNEFNERFLEELNKVTPEFREKAMKKESLYNIDANLNDADWVKQSWDLPEYGSKEFNEYLKSSGMTLEKFKRLPVYKWAVERGEIKDNKKSIGLGTIFKY
jgi:hypothetical protein